MIEKPLIKNKSSNKEPNVLPNLLILGLIKPKNNAADMIRGAYIAYFWRQCRTSNSRLSVIKAFIVSPWTIIKDIREWTKRLGLAAKKAFGKSLVRQMLEQFYLHFVYSINSTDYYLQEFYRQDGLEMANSFVNRLALKNGVYNLLINYGNSMYGYPDSVSLNKKTAFINFCKKNSIPVVPIIMRFQANGTVIDYRDGNQNKMILPQEDLFCKPDKGKEGRGAEAWYWNGKGGYENSEGVKLNRDELKERLYVLAKYHSSKAYIVQPIMLPHHDLKPFRINATPTIRIISYLDSERVIKIDGAMLRFSLNPIIVVDNACLGGMVAAIDPMTGKLRSATMGGSIDRINKRIKIMDDNKTRIQGFQIPYWEESCKLIIKLHHYFPHRIIIAWDVLISQEGPLILEGNSQSGLYALQKAHLTPLGKMDLGNAMASHIQDAFNTFYSGLLGNDKNNAKNESIDLFRGSKLRRQLAWLRLDSSKAVHLIINGNLQDVYYLKWLKKKAKNYRINGWVRNNIDGTVETVLKGKAIDIEDLVNECWKGPPKAEVSSIKAYWYDDTVPNKFEKKNS